MMKKNKQKFVPVLNLSLLQLNNTSFYSFCQRFPVVSQIKETIITLI